MGIGTGIFLISQITAKPDFVPEKIETLDYKVFEQEKSIAYTLTIPNHQLYTIRPFVAPTIISVAQAAKQTQALAAINAGYFDPINQKTTSIVVIDGREIATPKENERLMNNPNLSSYLPSILNRSEFRIYLCNKKVVYEIAIHSAPTPTNCQLRHAMGGGPQLLPIDTAQQEGFTDYANGTLIRDAIGSQQPNARTAIGLKADGSVVWVMISQKKGANSSGMTLEDLANFMHSLGVQAALNLDGGSSASLFYKGQAIYGKRNDSGQPIEREVKSVLLLFGVF
ncbi:MAG: phosphodiester glycosidase family protein [Thermosynechococcaceae cyanobacterium]